MLILEWKTWNVMMINIGASLVSGVGDVTQSVSIPYYTRVVMCACVQVVPSISWQLKGHVPSVPSPLEASHQPSYHN